MSSLLAGRGKDVREREKSMDEVKWDKNSGNGSGWARGHATADTDVTTNETSKMRVARSIFHDA